MIHNLTKIFICIVIAGVACTGNSAETDLVKEESLERSNLPDSLKTIDNLTVYSIQDQPYDTVEFKREQVFESSNEILFDGHTGEVAIDNQDNVYIAVLKPGAVGVYVFNPDGSFKTKFLRKGRGPGEFVKISDMLLNDNNLYVFGDVLQKIGKFSLDGYSLSEEVKVLRDSLNDTLAMLKAENMLTVTFNDKLILKFDSGGITNPNMLDSIYFYKATQGGSIGTEAILSQPKISYYEPNSRTSSEGEFRVPRTMPFSRNTLISASENMLYIAWTEHFLIKMYNKVGTYQRAFYYPYQQSSLSISETDIGKSKRQLIAENPDKVPNTWPSLHNMITDDSGRLWILTITDSDSTYQGWVLGQQGKLLARFEWPGHREERTPEVRPLFKIKNGYLYTRERDISKGIDRIVKHKIHFKEQ